MLIPSSRHLHRWQGTLLLSVITLSLAGCADPLADSTAAKLQTIGNLFGPYCISHGLQGPGSEAEFKKYIRACPTLQLQTLKVTPDNLEPLFSSDRDNQPFVFRYGIRLSSQGGKSTQQVVAYEHDGKSGKRLALYASGKVEMINEDTLQKLIQ